MSPVLRPSLAPNAAMRWDLVRRLLRTIPTNSILEIGCGGGGFGVRLAARGEYLGIEPDLDSYATAKARIEPRGGAVRNATFAELGDEREFDLVCAFEVIEHIEDDVAAISEFSRSVRPGGWIMLSAPSRPDRFSHWDTMVGHYRRYTPASMSDLLSGAGFEQVSVRSFGWPLTYATEPIRNQVAAKRRDRTANSIADRTAGSGRQLQPRVLAGTVIEALTIPFSLLQRVAPERGLGVVGIGQRPYDSP